jgi:transcriptional regulator with XRE-family HTH domain
VIHLEGLAVPVRSSRGPPVSDTGGVVRRKPTPPPNSKDGSCGKALFARSCISPKCRVRERDRARLDGSGPSYGRQRDCRRGCCGGEHDPCPAAATGPGGLAAAWHQGQVEMGRPEVPITPDDGPVARFALALRAERAAAGLTYREMAARVHYSSSALSQAANGVRMPNWKITEAYLRAVEVDPIQMLKWQRRWLDTQAAAANLDPSADRPGDGARSDVVAKALVAAALPVLPMLRRPAPNPDAMTSIADFVEGLRWMRLSTGLSYRQLSERARYLFLPRLGLDRAGGLAPSSIREILTGYRPPSTSFVAVFVLACGLPADEALRWTTACRRIRTEERKELRARQALNAMIEDPSPPGDTAEYERLAELLRQQLDADRNGPVEVDRSGPAPRPYRPGRHRRPVKLLRHAKTGTVWLLMAALLLVLTVGPLRL